ncbi:GNAT family N-acetyltransferase [Bacillus sp. JCM 19041]|uniref:GNAT family N-acetyltransferase n=1 Tax=Bacillus sp. JCM 19041 TaxID=1460637 RepID=UPI0006D07FFE
MFTYRGYQSGDEQQIISLWNQTMPHDPINSKRFRHLVLLDANFDPDGLRLAFSGDALVGCVYAVRRLLPMEGTDLESETGWIPFFFVAPLFQRSGVGKQLVNQAISFLKDAGRSTVFFASYAPNYLLPGLDEQTYPIATSFLTKLGFKKMYSPVAMDKSLLSFSYSNDITRLKEKRIDEGYSFSICADKDLYDVIQFAKNEFNPDWGRAIREGLMQGLPIERILIVRKAAKIVGFCMYGGYEGIPERFGPFGVNKVEQGKGLGKILLNDCLWKMKQEGLHGAWFLWTGEQSPAGHLYQGFDFKVTRRFHVFRREI